MKNAFLAGCYANHLLTLRAVNQHTLGLAFHVLRKGMVCKIQDRRIENQTAKDINSKRDEVWP